MNYVGIAWAYRRATWCALNEAGRIEGEGLIPADEDDLAHLALELGTDVKACVETMSGAVWVKDRLELGGWSVEVAHAGKVGDIAPLACKTDKVDARVLAELCRRNLVPAVWVAYRGDRAIRERLRLLLSNGDELGRPRAGAVGLPRDAAADDSRNDSAQSKPRNGFPGCSHARLRRVAGASSATPSVVLPRHNPPEAQT